MTKIKMIKNRTSYLDKNFKKNILEKIKNIISI